MREYGSLKTFNSRNLVMKNTIVKESAWGTSVQLLTTLLAFAAVKVHAQMSFSFMEKPGHTYQIQSNSALGNRFWQDVSVVPLPTKQVGMSLSLPTSGP